MAWFKKKPAAPAEVTLERVTRSFDEHDVEYFRSDHGDEHGIPPSVYVGVQGVPVIVAVDGPWLHVSGKRFNLPFPKERGDELIAWLNSYMASIRFGTCEIMFDEEVGRYDLSCSVNFWVEPGLYDDQLDEYLAAALNCAVDCVTTFCEHYGIDTSED